MKFRGKIIDLTQEIYQGMPVYPGHLKTVIWTLITGVTPAMIASFPFQLIQVQDIIEG